MMLLPLLLLASPTPAVARNTSTACAPARCGSLTVVYPFWLAGTHPPECGYRAFQVTCDSQGNLSLANSFWRHQILDIFYPNNSFRAINIDLMSNDTCDLDTFFNVSSDLGLSPFSISAKNQELFLYDCDPRERQIPCSWTRVRCPPWSDVSDPFRESTVLTVSVSGSVANTHRIQKWYKSLTSHTKHETES